MNARNQHPLKAWLPRNGMVGISRIVLMSALVLSAGITLEADAAARQVGNASWYGPGFHGKRTASGQRFDQNRLTAAHRRLPLGTRARVTNLVNGRKVDVTINDRGPYVGGRIIDLSRAAARRLAIGGVGRVKVETLP